MSYYSRKKDRCGRSNYSSCTGCTGYSPCQQNFYGSRPYHINCNVDDFALVSSSAKKSTSKATTPDTSALVVSHSTTMKPTNSDNKIADTDTDTDTATTTTTTTACISEIASAAALKRQGENLSYTGKWLESYEYMSAGRAYTASKDHWNALNAFMSAANSVRQVKDAGKDKEEAALMRALDANAERPSYTSDKRGTLLQQLLDHCYNTKDYATAAEHARSLVNFHIAEQNLVKTSEYRSAVGDMLLLGLKFEDARAVYLDCIKHAHKRAFETASSTWMTTNDINKHAWSVISSNIAKSFIVEMCVSRSFDKSLAYVRKLVEEHQVEEYQAANKCLTKLVSHVVAQGTHNGDALELWRSCQLTLPSSGVTYPVWNNIIFTAISQCREQRDTDAATALSFTDYNKQFQDDTVFDRVIGEGDDTCGNIDNGSVLAADGDKPQDHLSTNVKDGPGSHCLHEKAQYIIDQSCADDHDTDHFVNNYDTLVSVTTTTTIPTTTTTAVAPPNSTDNNKVCLVVKSCTNTTDTLKDNCSQYCDDRETNAPTTATTNTTNNHDDDAEFEIVH